jgi:hypothetical protein
MKSNYKKIIRLLLVVAILPNIAIAQLPSYLPANGLVAWYPFNGNANDESGNGNNGTVDGAVLTTDRFGNNNSCYQFNGINSSISTLSGGPLNQSPRSFSLWLRTNKTGENYLIQYGNPTGAGDYFGIAMNNYCSGVGVDISNGVAMWGPNSLTNNNWHHCVIVFDPTVGSTLVDPIVYVDGVLQSSLNCSLSLNNNTQINTQELYPFLIGGGAPTPSSRHFQGDLDDIGIYNRALTQAEVTALYTSPTSGTSDDTTSTSPAPPGIPYQAEVRNESGEVLANTNVNVRFTLHEATANGTVSYQETHPLTTNELGLFAATIGGGTATQGTFAGINWSQTTKFLQVEVDAGNGYITMGNQQLMSVPYALYAANGPAGPQGPTGEVGPAGPQGPPGAPSTANFSHYIGEYFGGGVIYHLWKDASGTEHGLIVDLTDLGTPSEPYFTWSNVSEGEVGISAQSPWNGLNNSLAIVAQPGHVSSAAAVCLNSERGGQSDWYLPAIQELSILWNNLDIVSRTLAQIPEATQFIPWFYWSSTELSLNPYYFASHFNFNYGSTDIGPVSNTSPEKASSIYVRAIRAF